MDDKIRVGGVVGLEMYGIVVGTIHARMHHEDTRFNCCALTRLEYHRTDGQVGRSAPLQYFNVRFFLELQGALPFIGDGEGELTVFAELHITVIDFGLVYGKCRYATVIASPVCKQDCREQ